MSLKLLYVIGNLEVGGAERHLLQVLPRLKDKGYSISIYTLTDRGALAPQFEAEGVEVISPPFSETLQAFPRLLRRLILVFVSLFKLWWTLVFQRPDVVHFFLPEAYIAGGLSSLFVPGLKRVMSRRSLNEYQKRHPYLAKLEHRLHRRMNAVLGNSNAVATQLIEEGCALHHVGLIYNGLDLSQFDTTASREMKRSELGLSQNDFVMILVANLIAYKGHRDLLQGLAHVREQLPADWSLLCVGRDDGIGRDLAALARELELDDHVQWLGSRRDVPDLLKASDLGLLCSHEEGFSNSILEGMAVGLPMVVTNVGGNAESAQHGETALVVPAHSPKDLGQAIADLANDSEIRKRFGTAGAQRIRDQFTIERCVSRYHALYQGVSSHQMSSIQSLIDGA